MLESSSNYENAPWESRGAGAWGLLTDGAGVSLIGCSFAGFGGGAKELGFGGANDCGFGAKVEGFGGGAIVLGLGAIIEGGRCPTITDWAALTGFPIPIGFGGGAMPGA